MKPLKTVALEVEGKRYEVKYFDPADIDRECLADPAYVTSTASCCGACCVRNAYTVFRCFGSLTALHQAYERSNVIAHAWNADRFEELMNRLNPQLDEEEVWFVLFFDANYDAYVMFRTRAKLSTCVLYRHANSSAAVRGSAASFVCTRIVRVSLCILSIYATVVFSAGRRYAWCRMRK